MHIIVGTAGHIDHGKTALVKALTGVDADRLPEEKQRGITIDLGFAELDLGDVRIGFVDVPGHERFVKNMLAGASGIDIVLLIIAADEGVMPQTREHFDICRLLRIKQGIVVLTKCDVADAETRDLARLEAAELVQGSFLEDARVVEVSARSGEGLDVLKQTIADTARKLPGRMDMTVPRLPIDRSFSVKGFGAVATGTLGSGEIREGSEMELLPSGRRLRVRGLQTHGQTVKLAAAGQRTAVNLGGIDHSAVERGMQLGEVGALRPTQVFDAEVEVLKGAPKPLRSRQRVRVHIGTSEVLARIAVLNARREIEPGGKDFVQFRLESPIICILGDRFIVRSYSPQATIAGGEVLLALSPRHRARDADAVNFFLRSLEAASGDLNTQVQLMVKNAGEAGSTFSLLQALTGVRKELLRHAIDEAKRSGRVVEAGELLLSDHVVGELRTRLVDEVARHHKREPLSRGMPKEVLRERVFRGRSDVFQSIAAELERRGLVTQDRDVIRLAGHDSELSPEETKALEKLRAIYAEAGLEVPKLEETLANAAAGSGLDRRAVRKVFQLLLDSGELTQISDEFFFERSVVERVIRDLRKHADLSADRVIEVPKFKEIAGISRKYAIPLLEHFDRTKVTQRVGEKRVVMK
jgi:selenocysteine-specific elongation factor